MTTQLPERLRDLADEAPGPFSAAGMWREARRKHRRRVAAASIVVGAIVALAGASGYGDWHSRQPQPVSPTESGVDPMAIPDQLFTPSPWLPTTRTPGRLIALTSRSRAHFPFGSDRSALVGIAAGSQTYRFLDPPGQSPDSTDVSLSPDGRHLAYWINGEPAGTARLGDRSIIGFAVLDLTSGAVDRHVVPSEHGLAPAALTWVDESTIALVTGHFTSSEVTSYSARNRTYLFRLGSQTATRLRGGNLRQTPVAATQGFAGMVDARRLRTYHGPTEARGRDLELSDPVLSVAYDVRRGLVAATRGRDDGDGLLPAPLVYGRVAGDRVHLHEVPGARRYEQVFTWVDPTHVTASRLTRDGVEYDVVDVTTGRRNQLTSKPWYSFSIAQDALRDPRTVPGVAPESPWNPRLLALGGLLLVGCAGAVVMVARRSVVRT